MQRAHGEDRGRRSALTNRNLRRFLAGQGISHTGLWLQQTAELWLVLQLTGSGTALGVATALRFGPILVLGAYGGLLGDRADRRTLLLWTAALQAFGAATLAALTWTGAPSLTTVYALIAVQGLIGAVDNPLRRSFVRDLADDDHLSQAVSLNGTVGTLARTLGPALGGITIAALGTAWCFALNAVSYGAVIASLLLLDRSRLRDSPPVARASGQVRAGLRYAWAEPRLRSTLVLTVVISTFAWNWNVLLPVYATDVFRGDADLYGSLVAVLSGGSVVGAVLATRRRRLEHVDLVGAGAVLAAALAITGLAPVLSLGIVGLILLGGAGTSFTIAAQARLQRHLRDDMNGRVMALFTVGWIGTKPVGGLVGGWVTDAVGVRAAFGLGAVVVTGAVGAALIAGRDRPRGRPLTAGGDAGGLAPRDADDPTGYGPAAVLAAYDPEPSMSPPRATRIGVIGAGAIGTSIAVDMTEASHPVTVVDQWPAHVEALRTTGARVERPDGKVEVRLDALHVHELASRQPRFDLVYLACKGYDARWMAALVEPYLTPDATVVVAQNGMTTEVVADVVGGHRTLGAVVELSAEIFEPGIVQRDTTRDGTWFALGELDGSRTDRLERARDVLATAARVDVSDDILAAKWTKLVVNSMTMGPFGLFGLRNWEAVRLPGMFDISVELGRESMAVGRALGHRVEPIFGLPAEEFDRPDDEVLVTVMETLMAHIGPSSSTAPVHDHRKGRRSEIGQISGEVVRRGRELGIATPANAAVTELHARIDAGELPMEPGNLDRLRQLLRAADEA